MDNVAIQPTGSALSTRGIQAGFSPAAPWWQQDVGAQMLALHSSADGLAVEEAALRLARDGPNVLQAAAGGLWWRQLLRRLGNPFIVLLLGACLVSVLVEQHSSALLIIAIVALSVGLSLFQEHRAGRVIAALQQSAAVRASVLRGGRLRAVPVTGLVAGDVVQLAAGQQVPADGLLLSAGDLFVNQAELTGEPFPVERRAQGGAQDETVLLMGSTVISGSARMLVCAAGKRTRLGGMAEAATTQRPPASFERELARFGSMMLRLTVLLVLFVGLATALAHVPPLQSFLFALALAVGLTPELLPMVVTVTLSGGARRLAASQVIVKRLSAIHDLGAIDLLATDKTGTLTEGRIRLERHVGVDGQDSALVLQYAWLNCHFESGVRTPMEDAVLGHAHLNAEGWRKLDEVPFDFERRRLSVLLARKQDDGEERWLILKGAPEDVLAHCSQVVQATGLDSPVALDAGAQAQAQAQLASLESAGFRTLAVAVRRMAPERDHARLDDETELTLLGFLAFLDPPKPGAREAVASLQRLGVQIRVVTGDSELVTQYICGRLGIAHAGAVLRGSDIALLDDAALQVRAAGAALFCRVTPLQKERIIRALRGTGHVVGYLGDGINDAAALHGADVGISVDTAADVAREAADLILLRQDLGVIAQGVREGRRTFANVMKYLRTGASSNCGNMLSMAGAALFLPFLPMLPIQILLNNMLYDLSQTALPFDAVDEAQLAQPQKLDEGALRRFMLAMGAVSSLFDFLTFLVLLKLFGFGAAAFQSAWFVESLTSQVLVIFVIRSPQGRGTHAHPVLAGTALAAIGAALLLPLLPVGAHFGFVPLPATCYLALAALVAAYLLAARLMLGVLLRAAAGCGSAAGP